MPRIKFGVFLTAALLLVTATSVLAAPKAELWPRWQTNNPQSRVHVDHSAWDSFLKTYLVTNHPSGVSRMRYSAVTKKDRKALDGYLELMKGVHISELGRAEQKAYWTNLYNALTVRVILDHYPVKSIRDIDISPGLFSDGPWGAKLVTVEGEKVSLDDIEHRILRPIWKDNRVHYAVNCASIGCPNLQPEAFTADNTERLLEKGAREYVNHPRGAKVEGNSLTVSSIYDWFQPDFGGSGDGVIKHLLKYADGPLADKLNGFNGGMSYDYDWRLNE